MVQKNIIVYDFDKTIYAGDSMVDFYLYNIVHNPLLLRYLPSQLWHIFLFVLGREDRTSVKTHFFRYLNGVNDVEKKISDFWDKKISRIQEWYQQKDHSTDVIVTASPEFLISPVAEQFKVELIGTKMDSNTGKITGKNCYGEEKVRRLKLAYPSTAISEAYGDRESDMPILRLAEKAFIVKGSSVTLLKR